MRALWLAAAVVAMGAHDVRAQKVDANTVQYGFPISSKTCDLGWVMVQVATRAGLPDGLQATVMKCAPAGDLVDPK